MSPSIFAKPIHEGRPIELYHLGFVKRDYSFIDDIVAGTLAVLDKPAEAPGNRLYNLGSARSEDIMAGVPLFGKAPGPKPGGGLHTRAPFSLQRAPPHHPHPPRGVAWTT